MQSLINLLARLDLQELRTLAVGDGLKSDSTSTDG